MRSLEKLDTNPHGDPHREITRLIEVYGNTLLRMCFVYLKDYQLAENAVQDTFVKALKGYSGFLGKAEEKTWLMRIAINTCKNYLRGTWYRYIDPGKALEHIPCEPDPHFERDNSLVLEIMKLAPKYREVILLFYYQDMKIREIGNVLKIPDSTVSIRLKRARAILNNRLRGWYDV